MLHIPPEAHHLHPLWVIVDKLSLRGRPLFPQATDIEVFILYSQPLRFKPW